MQNQIEQKTGRNYNFSARILLYSFYYNHTFVREFWVSVVQAAASGKLEDHANYLRCLNILSYYGINVNG